MTTVPTRNFRVAFTPVLTQRGCVHNQSRMSGSRVHDRLAIYLAHRAVLSQVEVRLHVLMLASNHVFIGLGEGDLEVDSVESYSDQGVSGGREERRRSHSLHVRNERPNYDNSVSHLPARHLTACHLTGCHLTGCHLIGCHMTGCHLTGCHMTGRHMTGRHLTGRHLTGRHLTGRHLPGRHLTGCSILLLMERSPFDGNTRAEKAAANTNNIWTYG